jgi:hypothetical protein
LSERFIASKERAFFSEEKKQKTFIYVAVVLLGRP